MNTIELETPKTLSRLPHRAEFEQSDYDWKKQGRPGPTNYSTWNSTQTFDYKGQPKDAKSDEDE